MKTWIVLAAILLAPFTCFLSLFLLLLLIPGSKRNSEREMPTRIQTTKPQANQQVGSAGDLHTEVKKQNTLSPKPILIMLIIFLALAGIGLIAEVASQVTFRLAGVKYSKIENEAVASYEEGDFQKAEEKFAELLDYSTSTNRFRNDKSVSSKIRISQAVAALELGKTEVALDLAVKAADNKGDRIVLPKPIMSASEEVINKLEDMATEKILPNIYWMKKGDNYVNGGDLPSALTAYHAAAEASREAFQKIFPVDDDKFVISSPPNSIVLLNLLESHYKLGWTESEVYGIKYSIQSSRGESLMNSWSTGGLAASFEGLSREQAGLRSLAAVALAGHVCAKIRSMGMGKPCNEKLPPLRDARAFLETYYNNLKDFEVRASNVEVLFEEDAKTYPWMYRHFRFLSANTWKLVDEATKEIELCEEAIRRKSELAREESQRPRYVSFNERLTEVKKGMTYSQIVDLLGVEGSLLSSGQTNSYRTDTYIFSDPASSTNCWFLSFKDGKYDGTIVRVNC